MIDGETTRLVLSAGTMRGAGPDAYLSAASGAGFDGASFRPAEVTTWLGERAGRRPADLAVAVADAGMTIAELDPITHWTDGVGDDGLQVLDLAAELDAETLVAMVEPGATVTAASVRDAFAELCAQASQRSVDVVFEFFSWSPVRTLAQARQIVEGSGATNAGLVLDTWHHARVGGTLDEVRATPPGLIRSLQVSDGPATPAIDDIAEECRHHRRWPGDGDLDPGAVWASLRANGWQGHLGVEVFGDADPDPRERARRAMTALRHLG